MNRRVDCSDPGLEHEPIDIPALKARYQRERDRRWRPDGTTQYTAVRGEYAEFYERDNSAPEPLKRDPVRQDIDVAVIGAGFAGLMAGAALRKAGVDDFRIIDLGRDFGGTWYWNRYPGVQCDIESYCYMPLLEELNYIPKEKYAFGPEIFDHCQRIGRHFRLYEQALFGTLVTALRWDARLSRWRISTSHGDDIRARFVLMGTGPFSRPKLPGIPGIRDFKGRSFHTSRWDFDYTGGDTTGGLVKLADKSVAVIGTGATAIQVIPHVGRHAQRLYVFQRTPSSVDLRRNAPTDPEWAKSLRPGWQRARRENLNDMLKGQPVGVDMVCDGWTEINRQLIDLRDGMTAEEVGAFIEAQDFRKMTRLRARIDEIVARPDVAEALKPWYRYYCKRPTFSDEYLPTFNLPNVSLVDVSGDRGVERVTETGVVAGGVEYPVDCIIYASGFEVTSEASRRIGIPVVEGRDGRSLYEHWKDGLRTLHGFTTTGFPNIFFTGYTQVAISGNFTSMLDDQTRHIAYIIHETLRRGAATVEPAQEAQDAWVKTIRDLTISVGDFWEACTPGYYNNEGGPMKRSDPLGDDYSPGVNAFNQLLADWREAGEMRGLVVRAAELEDAGAE
jgi:cyclohexanone monooxygenase